MGESRVHDLQPKYEKKQKLKSKWKKEDEAVSVAVDVCLSPPAARGQRPPCRSSGKEEEVLRTYSRVSASFFWNSSSDSWLRRFLFRRLWRENDDDDTKGNSRIENCLLTLTEVMHMQDRTGAGSHSLSSSFRSSKAPRSTRLIWFSIRWLQTETTQTEDHQRRTDSHFTKKRGRNVVCSRVEKQ